MPLILLKSPPLPNFQSQRCKLLLVSLKSCATFVGHTNNPENALWTELML
jgi:hypothetical protein